FGALRFDGEGVHLDAVWAGEEDIALPFLGSPVGGDGDGEEALWIAVERIDGFGSAFGRGDRGRGRALSAFSAAGAIGWRLNGLASSQKERDQEDVAEGGHSVLHRALGYS